MTVTQDRWATARTAVAEAGERFAALVAGSDPNTMATADWTVADTAAHVLGIARLYTRVLAADESLLPPARDQVLATTVDTVSVLNERMLAQISQRDPATLVEHLRADIADILRSAEHADPTAVVPWLGDSRVPVCGLLSHLVNEFHIHGRDIARATGTPWVIPPAEAALFFEVFFVGVLRNGIGHLLDNDEPPSDRRIAVEFRSRHTVPVTVVLHRGKVTVEEPGGDTDARVRFDPPTLNLMMFHRISKVRAALSGGIVVLGRRPWLLPAFLRTVRCP